MVLAAEIHNEIFSDNERTSTNIGTKRVDEELNTLLIDKLFYSRIST